MFDSFEVNDYWRLSLSREDARHTLGPVTWGSRVLGTGRQALRFSNEPTED
jgi:hypothetical protein